ncbi:hypothetical protein GCM10027321_37380 [Massilia terrae]
MLILAALAGAVWWYWQHAHVQPQPAPVAAQGLRVETVNGETVVVVPSDMQRASGIATQALAAATVRPEQEVYAGVIDLQPLLDFGARLAAARADRASAAALASASQAQAARTQALFQDDRNASQKALQDARAAAQSDQAKLAASEAVLAGIQQQVRQQFGAALADAASSRGGAIWQKIETGRAAVLRVALPASMPAPANISVDAPAGGTLAGQRLSAAPQVDPLLQGAPHFYLVDAPLPAAARLIAHAGGAGQGKAGVLVPDSAVTWYGDQRWTYLKLAPERFVRRLLNVAAPAAGGVLVTEGLNAGQQVVTQGAALLLSEEQRPRGVSTQCKDPPECDD